MNKDLMKFWLTCPFCKKKFGVHPSIVVKYIDRLCGSMYEGIKKKWEKASEKQEEKE